MSASMAETIAAPRWWTRLHTVLAAVLVVLVAATLVVVIGGNRVLPWTTRAETRAATYTDVQTAAERAVLTFLDVDYRHMDERKKAVAAVSTGTFKQQYAATAASLAAAATKAKAVSKGTVRHVGVNAVKGSSATALVAADVVVTNTSTTSRKATKDCPHQGARCDKYRFVVTLTRTSAGWKMADLAGVS